MNRKGQITIFILIGVIIVLAGMLVFYLQSREGIEEDIVDDVPEAPAVRLFVQECLEETAYEALDILGSRGGSIVYEGEGVTTSYSIIDFLYDKGLKKVPSIEHMEEQLSLFAASQVDVCFANFSEFPGLEIEYREAIVLTTIRDDVLFEMNMPVTIRSGDKRTVISEFSARLPIRLTHILGIVEEIVDGQIEEPGWVDMSLMSGYDVDVVVHPHNDTVLVYEILDDQSMVDDAPYQFLFANQFENE